MVKNGQDQVVVLPKDMAFEGVSELQITKEGDTIIAMSPKLESSSFPPTVLTTCNIQHFIVF